MIHKIHRGKDLPSVKAGRPYQIVGFRQAVHDYSTVAFAQDIRNCTACHQGTSEAHVWFSNPSRVACGSCHDNIIWETGGGHIAGPRFDDSNCASCHIPQGESEFDVSVIGAHTIPCKSRQLRGLHMEILEVRNTAPGQRPAVNFKVSNADDGSSLAPTNLDGLDLHLVGPTTDYAFYLTENARGASFNGDTAVYRFHASLPEGAEGTWVVAADAYRNVTIDNHTEAGLIQREAVRNPVFYFSVTDPQPQPRRTVVSLSGCDSWHGECVYHSLRRYQVEECVLCHNLQGGTGLRSLKQTRTGELVCLSCHLEVRGPFVFEHGALSTGRCMTCHQPHGSNNPKQLIRAQVDRFCLECHTGVGNPGLGSQPPSFHHLRGPRYQNCTTCHVAIHGSDASPMLLR